MYKTTRVKARFGQDIVTFEDAVDPGEPDAQRIYLAHYAILSRMNSGTPEVKTFLSALSHDPEFQENAADILKVNMQGPAWMDAFFRAACNRALELLSQREAKEVQQLYGSTYGMF